MRSHDTQRQIARLQGDIERLQHQLTQVTQDEARLAQRIVQLNRDLANANSPSVAQNKQRDIQNRQSDTVRLQSKRAELTRRLGDKTAELHRNQQQQFREQGREQEDALARIRRDNERARQEQHDLVKSAFVHAPGTAVHEPYDAFICHATEDKDELARPLAESLSDAGFLVWYDEFRLKVGDSLRRSIDRGLASSRFGIVVLSPSFFAKNWPQYELDGLVAREMNGGKVILPLWHKISKAEVLARSPSLADKVALNTSTHTIEELVAELAVVIQGSA